MEATASFVPVASLDVFRVPASVAVVGASNGPRELGAEALAGGYRHPVHLVDRRGDGVIGQQCAAAGYMEGSGIGGIMLSRATRLYGRRRRTRPRGGGPRHHRWRT